jgi:diguanylate cyclase (GGDEF)-like protein
VRASYIRVQMTSFTPVNSLRGGSEREVFGITSISDRCFDTDRSTRAASKGSKGMPTPKTKSGDTIRAESDSEMRIAVAVEAKLQASVKSLRELEQPMDANTARTDNRQTAGSFPPLMADAIESLAELSLELERLSRAVTNRESELRKLFDLVQTVERGVLLEDVLGEIFKGFAGVIPFERIGCAFLAKDGLRLISYWAKSELGPVRIQPGYSRPMAGSSLETILTTGQPRIINDLEAYLVAKPNSDATRRIVSEGGRSSLTCPLIVDGRPLGFLFFTSCHKNTYRDTHQYIFRQIAGQVALVIDKSRLYQNMVEHNRLLQEKSQNLEVIATHDVTTGLLNRGAIDGMLQRIFDEGQKSGMRFGLIMADIDYFKRVNDTLGHAAGDLALKEFSSRIIAATRKADAVGRYGGEEFLIVVQNTTGQQLLDTAERLRLSVCDKPFDLNGSPYAITASFGAALADSGISSAAELTQRADQALYQAKAQNRNCSVLAAATV